MDWIKTEEYNHQSVIKAADQDFKIIKCFAETKNAKKNLVQIKKYSYICSEKTKTTVRQYFNHFKTYYYEQNRTC